MSVIKKSAVSLILTLAMILSMGVFAYATPSCIKHELIKVSAKQGSGTEAGNTEYYKCSVCGEIFSDKEGRNPVTCAEVGILPTAKGNIGPEVDFTLYSNGDLVIYGSGATYDYYGEYDVPSPFAGGPMSNEKDKLNRNYAVYDAIKKVIVKEGVTELGNGLFRGSSVTEAQFPLSLKRIGKEAFMDSKISNISFSEGLEIIENNAFKNCSALNEVKAPKSLKIIKEDAFFHTPFYDNPGPGIQYLGSVLFRDSRYNNAEQKTVNLETYEIKDGTTCICDDFLPEYVKVKNFEAPDSLIFIGNKGIWTIYPSLVDNWIGAKEKPGPVYLGRVLLLYNNSIKTTVADIKPGTVTIAPYAFNFGKRYTTINIPDSVEYIGECAFQDKLIKKIKLPPKLKVIERRVFYNSSIEEINFPDSIERIEEAAFCESKLKKAIMNNNIISIAPEVFKGCINLEKVRIPDKIRRIGAGTFMDTVKLSTIENTDPANLEHVGADTFKNCSVYEYIIGDIGEKGYIYFGKVLYAFKERSDIQAPENLVIKEGTISITDHALENIKKIKTIEIPDSVRYIGSFALSAQQEVKINKLPENLTYLGSFGLHYVHADRLDFPGNLISLGYLDVNNHSMMNIWCNNITCPKGSAAEKMLAEYEHTPYTALESSSSHALELIPAKAPTCIEKGMDTHYKCAVCGLLFEDYDGKKAITAKDIEIPLTDHIPAEEETENIIEPADGGFGSYDVVIYCSVCKKELSRKTFVANEDNIIIGDIDEDENISAADARLALRYSVGLETDFTEHQKTAADADNDKKVTAADARLILRVSVGLQNFI